MINDPIVNSALANCIYKYGPISDLSRTLTDQTLGFSRLNDFNDPYESDYRVIHYFHSIEDEKKLLDPPVNALTELQKLVTDYLSRIRVTCFSRTAVNNLMWSHYAKHHSGICYSFEHSPKSPLFDPDKMSWGNVIYSSLLPELKIFQDQTTRGMLPSILSDVVLTKSQDWAYEQEFRFYNSFDGNSLKYPIKALKAIILGRRVSESDEKKVIEQVTFFNKENKTDVKILFAHRVARSFNLGIHSNSIFQKSAENSFSASIPVLKNICSESITTLK